MEALQTEAACLSAEIESLQRLHGFQLSSLEYQTPGIKQASPEAATSGEDEARPQSNLTDTKGSLSPTPPPPRHKEENGPGRESLQAEEDLLGLQGKSSDSSKIFEMSKT